VRRDSQPESPLFNFANGTGLSQRLEELPKLQHKLSFFRMLSGSARITVTLDRNDISLR
jgi:hypothetical protein